MNNNDWTVFKVSSPVKTIQDSIQRVLHGAHQRLSSSPIRAAGASRPESTKQSQPSSQGQRKDDRRWRIEREKAKLEIWASGELSEAQGRLQSELHRKVLRLVSERDEAKAKVQVLKDELVNARREIEARIRAAEEKEREVDECYEQCYKEAETSYRAMIDQVRKSLEEEARTKLKTAIK
jgi:hypothetical protein